MKLVLAIIKPHKLDEVREALGAIDVQGLTVSEARGYGRQKGQTEIYRGAEYETNLVPKLRLEVVVSDDYADRVVETIQQAAGTGAIGDGKIFVIDVESVQTSCGWGVPMMELQHERETLQKYHRQVDPVLWVEKYQGRTKSIDGLPTRPTDRYFPGEA